jgi:hypothetical protein
LSLRALKVFGRPSHGKPASGQYDISVRRLKLGRIEAAGRRITDDPRDRSPGYYQLTPEYHFPRAFEENLDIPDKLLIKAMLDFFQE